MKTKNCKGKWLLGLLIIVVALCFGTSGKSYAADNMPPAVPGVVSAYVLYESEEIEINSTKPVYYTILKKDTDVLVKPVDLIPVARKSTYDLYYIDISTLAPGKEAYVGIATTTTPNSDGFVDVINVRVKPCASKVVFNLDYAAEGNKAKGRDVVYSVVVTNADKSVVTYDHSGRNSDTVKDIKNLAIQWRKGTNCAWQDIDELSKVQWESMKSSGAVLYLRIGAINQTGQHEGQRYGKEVKIKLAVSKAPAVKVDVNNLSLTIKNGMQFKGLGTDDLSWQTVLPVVATSTGEGAIRNPFAKTLYDPYTENTKTKASFISIKDIYEAATLKEHEDGSPIILEYRIAATTKKIASRTGVISIPVQCEAPTVSLGAESGSLKVSTITQASSDKTENAAFEFMFVIENDLTQNQFDITNAKWTAIKQGGLIKNTVKSAYVLKNGIKRQVSFSDTGAVMLVRRKGVSGGGKNIDILASKYTMVQIPADVVVVPAQK